MSACTRLADQLDGQIGTRQQVTRRAQEEFRGNKAQEFDERLRVNEANATSLITNLRAMRSALAAAEQWAAEEQAAREQARQEEDDRRWFGLKGIYNDIVG